MLIKIILFVNSKTSPKFQPHYVTEKSTMSGVDSLSSNLSTLSYPRTGKRGVPQQFARRLYEMLQSEAKLASASKDKDVYISWSESGFAFRIHDVEGFTSSVLPKYFRTKKFSSFQRNLNLVSSHEISKRVIEPFPIIGCQARNRLLTANCLSSHCHCSMALPRCEEAQTQICTLINPSFGASPNCS